MKKIVLHIGTEKTATKSLQHFFCLNRLQLKKAGIWYPCSDHLDYCHGNAHFPLPASLFNNCPDFIPRQKHFRPEVLFSQLVRDFESSNEEIALLSAEHFSSRCTQKEQIKKISHYLEGFHVHILVYVRPQDELIVSAYSTYLKNGGGEPLEKLVKENCFREEISYLNYRLMISQWWEVFGKDRITVRVFQKKRMDNENVFDDIRSVLNIPSTLPFHIPEKRNRSVSREAAEFLFFSNQHFPGFDEGNRSGWERGQQFRSEFLSLLPKGKPLQQLLSDELKEKIKDFYASGNRELALQLRSDLKGLLFLDDNGNSKDEEDKPGNCYSHDFVKWVVDQWKTAHPEP